MTVHKTKHIKVIPFGYDKWLDIIDKFNLRMMTYEQKMDYFAKMWRNSMVFWNR